MRWLAVIEVGMLLVAACAPRPAPEPSCVAAETTARDPVSGVCRVFSTNCTPAGWELGCVVEARNASQAPLDKSACRQDAECVCGGIDELSNDCFIGNREYWREHVDKSRDCPDFCGGIGGDLVVRCREGRCVQESVSSEQLFCAQSGGTWTECGSGCGPLRVGQSPKDREVCPAVCVPQCKCPSLSPYWDDARGCVGGSGAPANGRSLGPQGSECAAEEDCARAGCSNQLCVPAAEAPGVITTCEWRPEYAHPGEYCGCRQGRCAWLPQK